MSWKEGNIRQKGCEQAEMGCVYPLVEMGNPGANRLSSPWVQVIESECWKHPLLFHAPRVNTLLGHLGRSSFESPHDISCLSLSHYFVSPFSEFWLFRTGWVFFCFRGKLMLAHPSHIIFIKRLYCIPYGSVLFPGSVRRDWESWENH